MSPLSRTLPRHAIPNRIAVLTCLTFYRLARSVFNPVPSSSSTSATSSQAPTPPPPQTPSAPDQYVYDLYYHSTTAPAAELAAAAAATVEGYVAEGEEELMAESDSDAESDEVDEDSNGPSLSFEHHGSRQGG